MTNVRVKCDNCHANTTKEHYCYGCNKYVCARCDQVLPVNNEHGIEEHLNGTSAKARGVAKRKRYKSDDVPQRKVRLTQEFSNKLYGVLKHNLLSHPYISHMYNGHWWEEALTSQVRGVVEMLAAKGRDGKEKVSTR